MMQTHLGGLRVGSQKDGAAANMGAVRCSQAVDVAFAADGTVVGKINLPAGSQIHDWDLDVTTAFNAATTNTLKVGTTAGGNDLVPASSVSATGRAAKTLTGANLLAMKNVGAADMTAFITFNQTGTVATAGAATVTCHYSVRNPDGSYANPA